MGQDQKYSNRFQIINKQINDEISFCKAIILEKRNNDFISKLKPCTSIIYTNSNKKSDFKLIEEIRKNMNKKCLFSLNNSIMLYHFFNLNNKINHLIDFFNKNYYMGIQDQKSIRRLINGYNLESKNQYRYIKNEINRRKSI